MAHLKSIGINLLIGATLAAAAIYMVTAPSTCRYEDVC